MKNLFENADEIIVRIDVLNPNAVRLWGKMEVAQMLAHCSEVLEVATNQKFPPRRFIGKILGSFFKSIYYNNKPFEKNGPSDKSFIIADQRDFMTEKERLIKLIKKFQTGGESNCTRHPHPFFGKLTPVQWSIGMHKHLDHHLNQFQA